MSEGDKTWETISALVVVFIAAVCVGAMIVIGAVIFIIIVALMAQCC